MAHNTGWQHVGKRPTNSYPVDELLSAREGRADLGAHGPAHSQTLKSLKNQTHANMTLADDKGDVNCNKPLLGNGKSCSGEGSSLLPCGYDPTSRVTFNVGGVKFQTTEATAKKVTNRDFKLADPRFLDHFYDAGREEYFFDRDPEVFRSVLNYWRTGQLHLPPSMCGPQIKAELDFWGLKELDIEPCCWNQYNNWMQTVSSLHQLEKDRKPNFITATARGPLGPRLTLWNILTNPSFSLVAKVYAYISLFFVCLAIFSFCASTHKVFQTGDPDEAPNNSSSVSSQNNTAVPNATTQSLTVPSTSPTVSPAESTTTKSVINQYSLIPTIHPALVIMDIVCLLFFTAEYLLKLITAPRRWHFVKTFTAVVDVLAILPDYLEFLILAFHPTPESAVGLVMSMPFLRLLRAFRIFRLIRRVPGLWIMIYTLRASFKELSLMLVFLLVGTLLFSSVIFFVDDTTVFTSIPHGFWWSIVTMTTVGYGDMTPKTMWGQIVGSVTAVCGVLIIGFTIPSLVNNFITFYQHVDFVVQKERLSEELILRRQRQEIEEKNMAAKQDDSENYPFPHQKNTPSVPLDEMVGQQESRY